MAICRLCDNSGMAKNTDIPARTTGQSAYDLPDNPFERTANNPFERAANEDDDGYDPYSDRPVYQPLFEKDPWR